MRLGAIAVAATVLMGCERAGDQPGSVQRKNAAAAATPAKDPLADMVSAVSGGGSSAPVELKFALGDRPTVGQELQIEVAVLPVSVLDQVAAHFQAGAGLELRDGKQLGPIAKPAAGVPLPHKLTIVPQRDGIFFVTATVHADSPRQQVSRTFSIPIIAGEGMAKPKDESTAQTGQPQDR